MVFINKDVWEGLDATTQGVILGAAAMAEESGWAEAERLANWYKEQLAANGMEVAPPSDTLRADFEKIGEQMMSEWLERAGDSGKGVIDAYRGG